MARNRLTPGGPGGPPYRRLAASAAVAAFAFALYRSTLLAGLDLGDTASFQAAAGDAILTPRQGYPLYFAVGNLFVWLSGGEPARAMNLASAIGAALACGVAAWVGAEIAGSLAGGVFAGLLFAVSYTFWSQAIIAEVYALHLLLAGASLAALLAWAARPSRRRLLVFFAVYALSFGNHLSMILLAPGFALFLLLSAPGGPRGVVNVRTALMAAAVASVAALQYGWNLSYLFHAPDPPATIADALQAFWFDVTKTDWRESMAFGVPESGVTRRAAMYWFDIRQQFGIAGVSLAIGGLASMARARVRIAALLFLLYGANAVFAFTYNVGDTHVFYLPSHLIVALLAGVGAARLVDLASRARPGHGVGRGFRSPFGKPLPTPCPAIAMAILLAYPLWRAFDDFPALDRRADRRATQTIERLTAGLDGGRSVFAADLNWQLENGLAYYARHVRPDLVCFRTPEVLLHFPYLVRANLEIGRDIALTPQGAGRVTAAYGDLFEMVPDADIAVPTLAARVSEVSRNAPYVLAVLAPYRDVPLDRADLDAAAHRLSGGSATLEPRASYNVMAGLTGQTPALLRSEAHPFRARVRLGRVRVDIRMESWLPADTIRRAGFGHVIANRRHALALDRGVSFVALRPDGAPALTAYAAGLYAPMPRFVIRAQPQPGLRSPMW